MRRFLPKFGVSLLLAMAFGAGAVVAPAQQSATQAIPTVLLDRVIAVINGDVLLESDLQEEIHYSVLQPYSIPSGQTNRIRALRRLINRTLILQQIREMNMQDLEPKESDVLQRIAEMRKEIPACVHYNCQSEEGWQDFLRANHFTVAQVKEHWAQRLEILNFIEERFRSGIHIPKEDVEKYYQEVLVPQFSKEKLSPPALSTIYNRVEEILLQQKVNDLLQDWLKSLRQRGGVEILDPEFKALATQDDKEEGED